MREMKLSANTSTRNPDEGVKYEDIRCRRCYRVYQHDRTGTHYQGTYKIQKREPFESPALKKRSWRFMARVKGDKLNPEGGWGFIPEGVGWHNIFKEVKCDGF